MRTLWSIVIWASDHLSASLEVGRVSLVIGMRCKSPSERLLKCNCSSLKLLRGLKSPVNRTHCPFGCVHWKPLHASPRSKYVHERHRHRHRRYRLHRLEVLGACLPNRSGGPSWTAKRTHRPLLRKCETILGIRGVFRRSLHAISSPFISEGGWVPSSCWVVVDPLGEKAFHQCVRTGWFLGIPTVFWRASWVGSARARQWSIFTGAKGYPLKALFGGVFHRGISAK